MFHSENSGSEGRGAWRESENWVFLCTALWFVPYKTAIKLRLTTITISFLFAFCMNYTKIQKKVEQQILHENSEKFLQIMLDIRITNILEL
jgi:hypothetical protein